MKIKHAAAYLDISVKTLERKIEAGDVLVAYVVSVMSLAA